jgi:hypothetical protein
MKTKNTVFILGAGASYGNGITENLDYFKKPPLVNNFLDSKITTDFIEPYTPLLKYLKTVINQEKNIEKIFEKIEGTWKLQLYDNREEIIELFGKEFMLSTPVEWLKSLVIDIIYSSTSWLKHKTCPYHDNLVKNHLHDGDSIISFNYDLIIDKSLKSLKQWHESTGYGFLTRVVGHYHDDIIESKVTLFKPHGSLNYYKGYDLVGYSNSPKSEKEPKKISQIQVIPVETAICGRTYSIDEEDAILNVVPENLETFKILIKNIEKDSIQYKLAVGGFSQNIEESGFLPLIVFPTPYKPIEELTYAELKYAWKGIKQKIIECDEIIAIGFSFNDPHFNQLLIESTRLNKRNPVIKSFNPKNVDDTDFLNSGIKVNHFPLTFKEFH